ncbi:ROK family protein [Pseudonocardia sp. HH130630-07]|uniref:ROK family protein n=1 Tax=Pseudonocardia sp. HH130630-07 TaxID=1690815 RepID=UPI000814ECEC|nr:ROK family protein [Pseudonocardia sp. HH130630-07]ANY07994.1 hypothetical protein AFB00_18725 [Pseudonocardia sp. HH130630-07]
MTRADDRCLIAVDVGGTTVKAALLDAGSGACLHELTVPTGVGTAGGAMGSLVAVTRRLRATASDGGRTVLAAGVVTPGTVDEHAGVVSYAANLGWRDVPLARTLRDALGVPVATGHDSRAAGRAEYLLGGRSADFVLVPIGTGIAVALVRDGLPLAGVSGAAGEFGHMPVHPDGEDCPCGLRGCLEVYCSASGILRRYRARGGLLGGVPDVVGALGRDPVARAVWGEAVDALALGLASVSMLLDPGEIVLAGGVAAAGTALVDPLQRALAARLGWHRRPQVRRGVLGPHAARTGAAVLAVERCDVAVDPARWVSGVAGPGPE